MKGSTTSTVASLISFLALIAGVWSFAPPVVPQERSTRTTTVSLQAARSNLNTAALSAATAAFLALNVASSPAMAATAHNSFDFSGTNNVIAARSGGRAGGRASSGGARSSSYSRPSSSSYSSSYHSTTIIRPTPSPTVIVSPPVTYGYGYSYNPLPGLGLGYAAGALGNIGNEMRDYRQESEIQRSKMELEQSRLKEAELEARLRGLEGREAAQYAAQQAAAAAQQQQPVTN